MVDHVAYAFLAKKKKMRRKKDAGTTVITNAKTIPSSDRHRESLEISMALLVVHITFARDVRHSITFLYIPTACTNNLFFFFFSISLKTPLAPHSSLQVATIPLLPISIT